MYERGENDVLMMNSSVRTSVVSLLVSVMILTLAACGSPAASTGTDSAKQTSDSKKTPSVALVVQTSAGEYYKYMADGAKKAGEELGVNIQVVGPNSPTDVMTQVSQIEDLLFSGVDAMCIAPCQADAVISSLNQNNTKHIPILFVDADADYPDKTAFLGTENYDAAKIGGEYMVKILKPKAKVALIGTMLGNANSDARTKGVSDALTAAGITPVETQYGNGVADQGMAVTENFLQKYTDLDAIFCANDEMAMGAARALEQCKRTTVKLIGFDGTLSALDAITAGKMTATVAQQPYEMGYQSVKTALKAINGEKVASKIAVNVVMITSDNAKKYEEDLKSKSK